MTRLDAVIALVTAPFPLFLILSVAAAIVVTAHHERRRP